MASRCHPHPILELGIGLQRGAGVSVGHLQSLAHLLTGPENLPPLFLYILSCFFSVLRSLTISQLTVLFTFLPVLSQFLILLSLFLTHNCPVILQFLTFSPELL